MPEQSAPKYGSDPEPLAVGLAAALPDPLTVAQRANPDVPLGFAASLPNELPPARVGRRNGGEQVLDAVERAIEAGRALWTADFLLGHVCVAEIFMDADPARVRLVRERLESLKAAHQARMARDAEIAAQLLVTERLTAVGARKVA